jgi:hypothetical protein
VYVFIVTYWGKEDGDDFSNVYIVLINKNMDRNEYIIDEDDEKKIRFVYLWR